MRYVSGILLAVALVTVAMFVGFWAGYTAGVFAVIPAAFVLMFAIAAAGAAIACGVVIGKRAIGLDYEAARSEAYKAKCEANRLRRALEKCTAERDSLVAGLRAYNTDGHDEAVRHESS